MKRNLLVMAISFLICTVITISAKADELKINVGVENGQAVTKVIGADIYASIDDKLYEITVSPDKLPFKMNLKTGALHLKGLWLVDKQAK